MNNIELLELDTLNLKCFRFRGPHSTCSGSSGSGSWRLGKKNRHSDRRTGKLSQIETRSAKCKPQVPQVPQVPQLAQLAQVAPAPWSFPSFASFSFSGPCKHASTPLMSLMDVWWSSEVAFPRPDSSSFSLWQILKIFIWSSSICMKPFGKVLSQDATCHTRCLRCLQMPSDAFSAHSLWIKQLVSLLCGLPDLRLQSRPRRGRILTGGDQRPGDNDPKWPNRPRKWKVETLPELSFGPV